MMTKMRMAMMNDDDGDCGDDTDVSVGDHDDDDVDDDGHVGADDGDDDNRCL